MFSRTSGGSFKSSMSCSIWAEGGVSVIEKLLIIYEKGEKCKVYSDVINLPIICLYGNMTYMMGKLL